ncbi:hypothetical protein ACFL5V_06290 [Fibrobacterota bacterium]
MPCVLLVLQLAAAAPRELESGPYAEAVNKTYREMYRVMYFVAVDKYTASPDSLAALHPELTKFVQSYKKALSEFRKVVPAPVRLKPLHNRLLFNYSRLYDCFSTLETGYQFGDFAIVSRMVSRADLYIREQRKLIPELRKQVNAVTDSLILMANQLKAREDSLQDSPEMADSAAMADSLGEALEQGPDSITGDNRKGSRGPAREPTEPVKIRTKE